MSFEVGDKVVGLIDNGYSITTCEALMEVVSLHYEEGEDEPNKMSVKVLGHIVDRANVGTVHDVDCNKFRLARDDDRHRIMMRTPPVPAPSIDTSPPRPVDELRDDVEARADAYMTDTCLPDLIQPSDIKQAFVAGLLNRKADAGDMGIGLDGSEPHLVAKLQHGVNEMQDVCNTMNGDCSKCIMNMQSAQRQMRGNNYSCLKKFTAELFRGNLQRLREGRPIDLREAMPVRTTNHGVGEGTA